MLEAKSVNLRIMGKDDLSLLVEWANRLWVLGEYNPLRQMFRSEMRALDLILYQSLHRL
jgi:hypothetical protein